MAAFKNSKKEENHFPLLPRFISRLPVFLSMYKFRLYIAIE
jgi:hypothetical protein